MGASRFQELIGFWSWSTTAAACTCSCAGGPAGCAILEVVQIVEEKSSYNKPAHKTEGNTSRNVELVSFGQAHCIQDIRAKMVTVPVVSVSRFTELMLDRTSLTDLTCTGTDSTTIFKPFLWLLNIWPCKL